MSYRLLHLVPKNLLSHIVGRITRARLPFGLHKTLKLWFIRRYRVETGEAEFPVERYPTLGDFFIRRLKPGARPIASASLVSPVDGALTQMGRFQSDRPTLTQIKDQSYSLHDLVGPDLEVSPYLGGGFLTVYLAPYDYHRIHAPMAGRVTQVAYIPGALWPVNTWSVRHVPELFVVNERVAVELEGEAGKVLVVMVGATNVGRISLDFHSGVVGNAIPRTAERHWRPPSPVSLDKGQGLGCFELGSTVILILPESLMDRLDTTLESTLSGSGQVLVRMGQGLSR